MSGTCGPLTLETSRRGERASRKRKNEGEVIINLPDCPDWLPVGAREIWDKVIRDLKLAKIPLQRIDSSAIALFVLCIHETAQAVAAGNTKLVAHFTRDSIAWAGLIGASPGLRARLGIKR